MDELGNLQSEGHGISGFQTMLSIGLGQDQQFTLILQTLQQLRDVYGESVDKIVQGNTSNIVFLKSTDDSMLDTLQKMSGITHRSYIDSKTITRDMEKLWMKNEGKASYTMTTREEPVIKYNDMAFISERNSIVFRAGDSPIWNRNETILPMSWRLFKNTITQPGKEYTLQTIPTLSTAADFDVRKNQPDFQKMLDKRMKQALAADMAKVQYQSAYGYSDYDIEQLDPDVYANEIMNIINSSLHEDEESEERDFDDIFDNPDEMWDGELEENTEVTQAIADSQHEMAVANIGRFAGGTISIDNLTPLSGGKQASHLFDKEIAAAYLEVKGDMWQDTDYFKVVNGSLYGTDGKLYIRMVDQTDDLKALNESMNDSESNVYGDESIDEKEVKAIGSVVVEDAFYYFLASLESWNFAGGKFEEAMKREMNK